MGRGSKVEVNLAEGIECVGDGSIAMEDRPKPPRPLTSNEGKEYVQLYAVAAKNAILAGFDGGKNPMLSRRCILTLLIVEVHGANGYLVDQFFQTISNDRADEYGGTVENRIRFALEVMDAIAAAIGAEKAAIRISPWAKYYGIYAAFLSVA